MRATLVLLLAGCNAITGSGKRGHALRQVAPFDEVEVSGALAVDIATGPQDLELTGDDNLLDHITTEVHGHRLVIREDSELRPRLRLRVTAHAPAVRRVSLSGADHAYLQAIHGDALALDVSGAGKITADGAVQKLSIDISGAGSVEATALTADHVDVHISGAGKADVFATRSLAAHISGAGSIRYAGSPPKVTKDISGASSVRPQ